jgi:hypothetical protein
MIYDTLKFRKLATIRHTGDIKQWNLAAQMLNGPNEMPSAEEIT